jgi:MFS family permease
MLSTALVPIAQSLHASIADTGWLIAVLYLTTAVAQPSLGRLVDLFGPRRVYLASLSLVAAAGIFGLLASPLVGLVAVRVLLGVGTSGAYPAATRIFRERADATASEPARFAMAILTLAALSTTAVGPVIGGVLTSAFGWRSIFTVNVPLAFFAVLLILLWTRDRMSAGSLAGLPEQIDLVGIVLFAVFLLSLMTFLMKLKSGPLWLVLAGAVAFGVVLVVHSRRRQQPFIDLGMLARNRPLTMTYLRAAAISMIVFSVYYGFAQWLQSAAGFSSAAAGLVTLPMSLMAAGSSLTGVRTKGLRAPFLISTGAAFAGCVSLLFVHGGSPVWMIGAAITLFGLPLGGFSTATQAAVYLQAPPEEIGTAAGLQRTAQYLGAIAAASLLTLIYGQRASDHGLHSLAMMTGALGAILFIVTRSTASRVWSRRHRRRRPRSCPIHEGNKHAAQQTRRHLRAGCDRSAKRHCRAGVRTPPGEIVGRAAKLASAFRACGLPVVRVNVTGRAPGRTEVQFNFTPASRLGRTRCRARSPAERLHRDQAADQGLLRHRARTGPAPARRDRGGAGRRGDQRRC